VNSAPGDDFAAQLRGFGPLGLIAVVVILLSGTARYHSWAIPVGAILALAWVPLSGTPWRDIGYSKPKNWIAAVAIGIVFGVLLKFLLKAVVLPLLGADPANQAFGFLRGNRAVLPAAIWAMLMAGFGEETVFRGYLFERLGKLIGTSTWAKVFTVVFTSACFAGAHYTLQGIVGVQQAAITGLALGTAFALTGQIWIPMIAHAAFDLTALAIIYWNLEAAVAHLFFK
jgi:membrane protease YdiL (CAAX protease family)